MLKFVVTLFYLILFLGFPCVCCSGIAYHRRSDESKFIEFSIRIISLLGFILWGGLTYATHMIGTTDLGFEIDVPQLYEKIVFIFLPITILSITYLYAHIAKQSEKVASVRTYAWTIIFILVIDWQFLAFGQTSPEFLTSIPQSDSTILYKLTWFNFVPFFSANLIVFTAIIIALIRKLH